MHGAVWWDLRLGSPLTPLCFIIFLPRTNISARLGLSLNLCLFSALLVAQFLAHMTRT